MQAWIRQLVRWTVVLVAPVLAAAAISRIAYGFVYSWRGQASDALVLALLALPVLWATRSVARTLALVFPLVALVMVGQAASQAALGTPLRFSDVGAVPTLLSVLSPWQIAGFGAASVAIGLGLLWLLRCRWPRWPVLMAALALAGSAVIPGGWGHVLALRAMPPGGFQAARHGSLAYMLSENVGRRVVGPGAVAAIVGESQWSLAYRGPRRNIHLVLLETFWDPARLKHYRFSADPFDHRFRAWMDESRGAMALTPHFGHLTANAEFESLCGLPATEGGAIFVNHLRNPMPCLPRILGAMGYETQASHANTAGSWSRDRAYDLVGFSRFNAARSFEIDDVDELFLADASFYRQNAAALERPPGAPPVFNYLVSLSSHWPYRRDKQARPDVLKVSPENADLVDFANGLRYSSTAFADWVERIRERDPDALIVAYGDHAPVMPPKQAPYIASGFDMGNHANLSEEQLLQLSGTPLIVIDGRKGVIPVGVMPVSAIPQLILDLAFGGSVQLPQARALQNLGGQEIQVRRYLERLLVAKAGVWQDCDRGAPTATCAAGRRLLEAADLLRDDMAQGNAYFAGAMGLPASLTEDDRPLQMPALGCGAEVESFGPTQIALGQGFNVQKTSGKSAFWFNLKQRVGRPGIRVGDDRAPLEIFGLFGAAAFDAPAFVDKAGEHVVYLVCKGQADVAIGRVQVHAPGGPSRAPALPDDADMSVPLGFTQRAGTRVEGLGLIARASRQSCLAGEGWRGTVRVEWSIPGANAVRLSVRSSDGEAFKLWSSGGGSGQATTGPWAHGGMQVRIDADGRELGVFALDRTGCGT